MALRAYILRCTDGGFYTGHTDTLDPRIGAHQLGAFEGASVRAEPVEAHAKIPYSSDTRS